MEAFTRKTEKISSSTEVSSYQKVQFIIANVFGCKNGIGLFTPTTSNLQQVVAFSYKSLVVKDTPIIN